MNKKYVKDYSYIARGKQRIAVIKVMDKPLTVTRLKQAVELSLAETSRVLRGFADRGIAACLNPSDITGRVYELTPKGKTIRKEFL